MRDFLEKFVGYAILSIVIAVCIYIVFLMVLMSSGILILAGIILILFLLYDKFIASKASDYNIKGDRRWRF